MKMIFKFQKLNKKESILILGLPVGLPVGLLQHTLKNSVINTHNYIKMID
jgi:hypothetical protein